MATCPVMDPRSPKKIKVCFKWHSRASLRENEENHALMHTHTGKMHKSSMVALDARSEGPGEASFGLREQLEEIASSVPHTTRP